MPDVIINMHGDFTGGTEESIATVDVPEDGFIVGVQVSHVADLDADGEVSNVELSFIASLQITTNDTRALLAVSRMQSPVGAAAILAAQNFYIPMNVRVFSGERLHVHSNAAAGVAGSANFLLQLDTARAVPRRSVRRR